MLTSVDLFTGIGGFALALKGVFKPLVYCDKSAAVRELLHRCMADGRLPRARVVDDVRHPDAIVDAVRGRRVDVVTLGFPCTGFSLAGGMQGLLNADSSLFHDAMKVVARLRPRMVFLENVIGILTVNGGKDFETILASLTGAGYVARWTSTSAHEAGAPQLRRRWFCLAVRGGGSQGGAARIP